jgi:hypothetical protein
MKYTSIVTLSLAAMALVACDPIEDMGDRDKYNKDGAKEITAQELTAALSVVQLPNTGGVVGDQYVIVKNSRPDVGGVWQFTKGSSVTNYTTDNDTLVMGSNGEYSIKYIGIYGNKRVESNPLTINVTNVFDTYDNLLTGAVDKADKTAKKIWRYGTTNKGNATTNGAYGYWKYLDAYNDNTWWSPKSQASIYDESWMELAYDGMKLTIYNADGSIKRQGNFESSHDAPDDGVVGTFTTTCQIMGEEYTDVTKHPNGYTYWILALDANNIAIAITEPGWGYVDWDSSCGFVYYEAESK